MSDDQQIDYEDLTDMRLDDAALAELLDAGGECIFNWTTKDGHPVGVASRSVYHDGKFFTTCAERRKRVPALRTTTPVGHCHQQRGQDRNLQGRVDRACPRRSRGSTNSSSWFYAKRPSSTSSPTTHNGRASTSSSDSPHPVIIETDALALVVAFDTAKFHAFTVQAMAAGHGAD